MLKIRILAPERRAIGPSRCQHDTVRHGDLFGQTEARRAQRFGITTWNFGDTVTVSIPAPYRLLFGTTKTVSIGERLRKRREIGTTGLWANHAHHQIFLGIFEFLDSLAYADDPSIIPPNFPARIPRPKTFSRSFVLRMKRSRT